MLYTVNTLEELQSYLNTHKLHQSEYYRMLINIQPTIRYHSQILKQKELAEILHIAPPKLSIVLQAIESATPQPPYTYTTIDPNLANLSIDPDLILYYKG